jgi:hypothetical protein
MVASASCIGGEPSCVGYWLQCRARIRRLLHHRSTPRGRFAASLEKGDRGLEGWRPSSSRAQVPLDDLSLCFADSSPSRGGPLLSLLERSCLCVSYTFTPPLCPNLDAGVAAAHNPNLDLAAIRQLPATTFSWGAFSLEAVVSSLNCLVSTSGQLASNWHTCWCFGSISIQFPLLCLIAQVDGKDL